ncbi:MAG: cobalamin-dependent protein [Clostridia bacterium]|nr:cobalamin-dependent protein [Clostridia bacterium]
MDYLHEISIQIQKGNAHGVRELVCLALSAGIPARQILSEGLTVGMNVVGERFRADEVFVPGVMLTARAMNVGIMELKPYLVNGSLPSYGNACIGTVQGDLHDIGKNIVRLMMESKGIRMIDLGVDVAPEKFIETAIAENCRLICCSALLTSTLDALEDVVKAVRSSLHAEKIKVMVGGQYVTRRFAASIKADFYAPDAVSAAELASDFLEQHMASPISSAVE